MATGADQKDSKHGQQDREQRRAWMHPDFERIDLFKAQGVGGTTTGSDYDSSI